MWQYYKFLTLIISLIIIVRCGFFQPDYEDYSAGDGATTDSGSTGGSTGSTTGSNCDSDALALFESTIFPVVKSTCATASCHAVTAISSTKNLSSSSTTARKAFKAYTGTDSTTLYDKIALKNGKSHGGKDQSSNLPLSTIEAWVTKEKQCSS